MRNNRNRIWLVTALLISCLTACTNSASTGSSPLSVTPGVSKAVYVPPTVNVYNDSLFTVHVSETYSGAECWSPTSAVIDSLNSQKFTPTGDLCSGGTLTANYSTVLSNECQLGWDGFLVTVVNHSNTNCTWGVTGTGVGTFTYMLITPERRRGK